jgi:hypothetical protein
MTPLYYVRTSTPWRFDPLSTLLGRLAALLGTIATASYAFTGQGLSHYDAKAHLVVSRRIFDSLTPGWEQIGAVWLPLPHLLNALPVQIDHLYRTGGFAIAISVLAHAVATASLAGTVMLLTASRAGAVLAAGLYGANPNVLYLQSTPMTEPLLFALTSMQAYLLTKWVLAGRLTVPAAAGWVTVLACLTRYEAWPITGACFAASAYALWRRGHAAGDVARVFARLSMYPIVTVLAFMVFSRLTVGEWFVSGGFFVPDDTLRGQIVGLVLIGFATAGRSPLLIPIGLFASAALPLTAYLSGHPFRLRYEIPLLLGCALVVGLAVGLLRTWARVTALIVFAAVTLERPPFDPRAAMVEEAQLDKNVGARQQVTRCLRSRYQGGVVMASMGSLGHYMHELSSVGFNIGDFLHEGNGPIWDSAFTRGPAALAEWVLVEEVAEGGDAVIQRHREIPRLLEDYDKVCGGGGVALYHRRPVP